MNRTLVFIIVSIIFIGSYGSLVLFIFSNDQQNDFREYSFDPALEMDRFNFPDDRGLNDSIMDSLRLSGDYLIKHIKYNGKWDYEFNASSGESNSGYNVLRHAGTTYSLALLFKYTRDPDYYNGTVLTLNYLFSRYLDFVQYNGTEIATVSGRSYTKLGGPGLALLALVELKKIDQDAGYQRELSGLKNYIIQMQRPNGSLQCYLGDREDQHSDYYPGEALLGLAKYHHFTNDTEALFALRKGLDYYNEYFSDGYTAYSPWATEAISYLHEIDGGPDLYLKANSMANSCKRGQLTERSTLDPYFAGAFSTSAGSSTASRIEAVTDAYLLTKRANDTYNSTRYLGSMNMCAGFLMRSQISRERSSDLPKPELSVGGIPNSRQDLTIRIDNVQHTVVVLVKIMVYQREPDII